MAIFKRGMACLLLAVSMPSSSSLQLGRVGQLLREPDLSGGEALQEPGCFVRKPHGCPNHPQFNSSDWRHAENAEKYRNARVNRTVCELDVWANMTEFCGTDAIEVVFVPAPEPDQNLPDESKLREASAEAEEKAEEKKEVEEEEDEEDEDARDDVWVDVEDKGTGEGSAVAEVDGVEDEGNSNEEATPESRPVPTEPGCFIRRLKGCPRHPQLKSTEWQHAAHAEKSTQARLNRTACEVDVKASVTRWCGTKEVEVLFIAGSGPDNRAVSEEVSDNIVVKGDGEIEKKEEAAEEAPAERTEDAAQGDVKKAEEVDQEAAAKTEEAPTEQEEAPVQNTEVELPGSNDEVLTQKPEQADKEAPTERRAAAAQGEVKKAEEPGEEGPDMPAPLPPYRSTEPGCFVRTPSGCPNHPNFGSRRWKHDKKAEAYVFARESRSACEVLRKEQVASWCGIEDVEMLYVAENEEATATTSAAPLQERAARGSLSTTATERAAAEPGCFVRTPSGCPNHPTFHSSEWKHEEFGERFRGARTNQSMCEVSRKQNVAHWCGVEEVETMFVPSNDPGCYVSTPSGCPNHPSFSSLSWQHEEYGEKHSGAKVNRTVCEVLRKAHVASWCGTDDVRMRFVPPDWGSLLSTTEARFSNFSHLEAPTEPGCFIRTPTGCPNHPSFGSSHWKHEGYGERSTGAKSNRTACEVDRKTHVAHWCGAKDVEALFIPTPDSGCFVRTPSGCPSHPLYASAEWKHEKFGEENAGARVDRLVCEHSRRDHIAHWCGVEDVETLFVPSFWDAA